MTTLKVDAAIRELGIEGIKTPRGLEPSIRYDLDYLRPIFPKNV